MAGVAKETTEEVVEELPLRFFQSTESVINEASIAIMVGTIVSTCAFLLHRWDKDRTLNSINQTIAANWPKKG